jgi:hypothetical protein
MQEDHKLEARPGKGNETLSQKQNKNKRAMGWEVAQVVEGLPSMHKALNPVHTKKPLTLGEATLDFPLPLT